MDELIDKQDAINALKRAEALTRAFGYHIVIETVKDLPSAKPRWIPCSERLPNDDTEVIVSCTDDSGDGKFSYVTTGWHFKGLWVVDNERCFFVRAWQPLPEPYREEG